MVDDLTLVGKVWKITSIALYITKEQVVSEQSGKESIIYFFGSI
jgi:hypothetical protein